MDIIFIYKPMDMKTLDQIVAEIKDICNLNPIMQERMEALKQIGYENIHYAYMKHGKGLFGALHLPKKQIYRIQIGYTELQKGYPAAWVLDIPAAIVESTVELPF